VSDILFKTQGVAGIVTLNRPNVLNALTYKMCLQLAAQLRVWEAEPCVRLILIRGNGARAFCAGGDLAEMYATGTAGDFSYGQRFWRDEYRLNAQIARYSKPIVSFLHGFTMGGGVGVGCHASHRVVCESSRIAMPETRVGLVPDVGGSLLLAHAPGHLGLYLGLTTTRMTPEDAIYTGFADIFIPQSQWPKIISVLCETGDITDLTAAASPLRSSALADARSEIDALFAGPTLDDIVFRLRQETSERAAPSLNQLEKNSPFAMACTLKLIRMLQSLEADAQTIEAALSWEFRITARSMEDGDFLEGIRSAIIDKDGAPRWRYPMDRVPTEAIDRQFAPLAGHPPLFEGVFA